MEEEIGDDDVGRFRTPKIFEHVLRDLVLPPAELRNRLPRRRSDNALLVDEDGLDARLVPREAPGEPKHQAAVARTKLDDPFRRGNGMMAHAPRHDPGVQHHRVQELEVAARPDRIGIVGRQNVEELGFEAAREGHPTSILFAQTTRPVRNNIVSAMRPGPNAMPQPAEPGLPSASSVFRMNMTVAEDMLPKSRRTPRDADIAEGAMAKARSTASTTVRPPG